MRSDRRRALPAVALLVLLSGCAGATVQPSPAATVLSPSPPSTTATAAATASPRPLGLAACPASQPVAGLPVLARTDLSPDDLLPVADGTLWVTDPVGGSIEHIAADGHVLATIADPLAPEGMVAIGGTIVMAEQTPNRLVSFAPPSSVRTTLLTLPARGSVEGIDGIGLDAGGRLLVPDSPHGTLLSAAVGGGQVVTLASGLGRDVAATTGPDGATYVAVEGDHGLLRVPAGGGAAVAVSGLSQLDDVVAAGQLLYATLLIAGEVVAVDPASGAFRVIATGIAASSAQGLALLPDGRLAVADSGTHVISLLVTCSA